MTATARRAIETEIRGQFTFLRSKSDADLLGAWQISKLSPDLGFTLEISKLSPVFIRAALRRRVTVTLSVLAIVLSPVPTRASDELDTQQELSPFSLRVGVYDMNLSTEVRVDGRGGNFGSRLDFENDLNLDSHKDTFDIALRWRLGERHFLEAQHFDLKRNGFRRVDGEIRFGESVFRVGADLQSAFTTEVTRLSYSYRLVRSRDWGLAIGAGLHITRLRAVLTEITFDNPNVPVGNAEVAAVTAPLPVFGFSGARRLGEKWALLARGQFFALDTDDIDGSIEHFAIHFEHATLDRLGLGFGYDWFNLDIDTEETRWRGSADVRFHGPMLYLKGDF